MHVKVYNVVGLEKQEDVLKVLQHGVELAEKDTEIVNILHLLYTAELYSEVYSDAGSFAKISEKLLSILSGKKLPTDGFDLMHSLQFVSSQRKVAPFLSQRAVFHRHAKNASAWNWLRNSIELVFTNDEYEDVRPVAAVAAVRAYKWKAIPYTADDVER